MFYLLRGDENAYRSYLSVVYFLNAGLLNPWTASDVCIQTLLCEECRERKEASAHSLLSVQRFSQWSERKKRGKEKGGREGDSSQHRPTCLGKDRSRKMEEEQEAN